MTAASTSPGGRPERRLARSSFVPLLVLSLLAMAGHGRAQTITATSAADYTTAINAANAAAPATETVVNGSGATISLGGVTLPTLAVGATLQIGNGSISSSLSGGTITNNGTLILAPPSFGNAPQDAIGTNIAGTGSVTVQTPFVSVLTLSGTNTWSGGTTLTTASGAPGAVLFATSASLPVTGTVLLQNAAGLGAGYALDQNTLNTIAPTSTGFVALGADSANDLDFTNLPTVSLGAVTTTPSAIVPFVFSGALTPNVNTQNGPVGIPQYLVGGGNGILNIATSLGDLQSAQAQTTLIAVNDGYTILSGTNTFSGGMTVNYGVVQLANAGAFSNCGGDCPGIVVNQTGILATSYALDQTTLNLTDASSNGTVALGSNSSNDLDFTNLPSVSLGAVGAFTYSGTITPGANGYLLGGGGDYRVTSVLTVTSVLSGANTLTINAPLFDQGTVILTAANTYTGQTTIQGGTLQLGNGVTNGTIANSAGVTIDNNVGTGTLAFSEATAISFDIPIDGVGNVVQNGPGTVTLTQNETYTGTTTVQGGTLALGAGGSIAPSTAVMLFGGTLDISAAGNQTVQNLSGLPGTFVVLGGNTLTDNANDNINSTGALTFAGVMSGTGGFIKQGADTLTFTGANTYTGITTIATGTLALGAGGSIAASHAVGLSANTVLDLTAGGNQTVQNLSNAAGASIVLGGNTLTENANDNADSTGPTTFAGVISGTGGFVKQGSNTLTLSGLNTYTGGTTIGAGTLALGTGGSIAASSFVSLTGSGALDISGGGSQAVQNLSGTSGTTVVLGANALVDQANAIGPLTFAGVMSGTGGFVKQGTGTLILTGTNTYTGGTTVSAGTLALGGATVGTVGSGAVAVTGMLAFTEPSAITFANVLSGTGTVLQAGPGTVTVNTANAAFTGLTEVQGGTLILGDTAGSPASVGGAAQVDAGGTLAGYGSIGGSLSNNGTVIPGGVGGNAPGTLSVGGDYVQGAGGTLVMAVTPAQSSHLQIAGNATLNGGHLNVVFAPGTYAPTTYILVSTVGSITGTFASPGLQGSVPTALNPQIQYLPGGPTVPLDPVVLVLSASPSGPTVTVAPANLSIFSEQLASLTLLADTNAATLLDGGTPGSGCPTANIPAVESGPGSAATASAGIAALGNVMCGLGGWIHADGTFLGVNSTGGLPGYSASTAGFLAGVDRPIGQTGLRLGVAVGYDHRGLNDTQGASATADVARLGVYAIQQAGRVTISAAFLYGHDWDTTHRPTGVGTAVAHYGADEFSGGVQASLPLPTGSFTLTPNIGFRFASVGSGAFGEAAAGPLAGFGVSGGSTSQTSLLPYARFVAARDFVTESGMFLSPFASLGVRYQAGDNQRPIDLTAADGTVFRVGSSHLDRAAGTAGVGIVAGHDNWVVFATYDAVVAGNWTQQAISGGLRVNF